MSIKTNIGSAGVNQTNNDSGLTIDWSSANSGFMPWAVQSSSYITAGATASVGMNIVSSSAAITASMPLATGCPGAMFIFRSTSAHGHVISSSSGLITNTSVAANTIAFPALANQCATLLSDGNRFQVLFNSSGSTVA